MKKKVLFIIYSSSIKSGGGHFYSLLTLIDSLSNDIDFKLLNVGLTYAKILKNTSKIPSTYIELSKSDYFSKSRVVKSEIQTYNPDVIHAFDLNALRLARTINLKNTPIIFSKCGGINGSKLIPNADTYICFSQENTDHLNKYKSNNNPLHLIPNRATKVGIDHKRIEALRKEYSLQDKKVFLRISRFSSLHELSIIQAINIFKLYYSKDKDSCLLLIGMRQEDDIFNRILNLVDGFPIHIVTNEYYCNEASKIIDIADIVIATGRGVMEAASLKKPIFCPLKGNDFPVAFSTENYEILSRYNFSGRVNGLENDPKKILNILLNDCEILSEFSNKAFKQNFDINSVKSKYLEIYNTVKKNKFSLKSLLNYIIDMSLFFKPKF